MFAMRLLAKLSGGISSCERCDKGLDWSLVDGLRHLGVNLQGTTGLLKEFTSITIAQAAPVLPYLMMVLMLIVRPTGLLGTRET